jgi:uncharacterized MnhB-related membrane protein
MRLNCTSLLAGLAMAAVALLAFDPGTAYGQCANCGNSQQRVITSNRLLLAPVTTQRVLVQQTPVETTVVEQVPSVLAVPSYNMMSMPGYATSRSMSMSIYGNGMMMRAPQRRGLFGRMRGSGGW